MLDSNMSEAEGGEVVVEDMELEVLEKVLEFIYTGGRERKGGEDDGGVQGNKGGNIVKNLEILEKHDVVSLNRVCARERERERE